MTFNLLIDVDILILKDDTIHLFWYFCADSEIQVQTYGKIICFPTYNLPYILQYVPKHIIWNTKLHTLTVKNS